VTVNIGEIRMMALNLVPQNCVPCDGTSLPANNYEALYTAIGTKYGSTGAGNFNLPDLRGCVPIHRSSSFPLGSTGGSELVALTSAQMPPHSHAMFGTTAAATQTTPLQNLLAQSANPGIYQSAVPGTQQMSSLAIGNSGDGTSHNNLQPFLAVNFVIAVLPLIGPPPPYMGEIRVFPFGFMPFGWLPCTGALLQISQNTALFHLLGTTFGGDGKTTFALPNLQGALPMGAGDGPGRTPRSIGATGGTAAVTLLETHLPTHSHPLAAQSASANASSPQANTFAQAVGSTPYVGATSTFAHMSGLTIAATGGGAAHNNLQPYMALNFGIAVQGSYVPPAS